MRLTTFRILLIPQSWARVAELVDAVDLKSIAREGVRVQVPPRVPAFARKEDKSGGCHAVDLKGVGGHRDPFQRRDYGLARPTLGQLSTYSLPEKATIGFWIFTRADAFAAGAIWGLAGSQGTGHDG